MLSLFHLKRDQINQNTKQQILGSRSAFLLIVGSIRKSDEFINSPVSEQDEEDRLNLIRENDLLLSLYYHPQPYFDTKQKWFDRLIEYQKWMNRLKVLQNKLLNPQVEPDLRKPCFPFLKELNNDDEKEYLGLMWDKETKTLVPSGKIIKFKKEVLPSEDYLETLNKLEKEIDLLIQNQTNQSTTDLNSVD